MYPGSIELFSREFHQRPVPQLMRAFKVARLCCPVQRQLLMPNAAALQEFENFPFVDDNTIANLAVELPAYVAAEDDIVDLSKEQQLAWWTARHHTLPHSASNPHSASLFRRLLLIQPSSAASKSVFSLLSTLSSQQDNALEHYILKHL